MHLETAMRPQMRQVHALPQDAPALQAMSWPAELRLVKTMPVASAVAALQGRPNFPTRLKMQQQVSSEAQVGVGLAAASGGGATRSAWRLMG